MSKYDKWYIIGKLLCFNFRICKKNLQICNNWVFFCKIQSKKKMSKNDNICIFKKPLTMPFQICKILNNLMCNWEKLKMCKFVLTGYMQIICKNFFEKLVQSVSFCHRISKKLKIIKIQQLKVGLNKDLVCYRKKVVIQMQCAWGLRQIV